MNVLRPREGCFFFVAKSIKDAGKIFDSVCRLWRESTRSGQPTEGAFMTQHKCFSLHDKLYFQMRVTLDAEGWKRYLFPYFEELGIEVADYRDGLVHFADGRTIPGEDVTPV